MNIMELEKKCEQFISWLNEYKQLIKYTYCMEKNKMDGYILRAKDEEDRIVYVGVFDNVRELYQYLRGMIAITDLWREEVSE